MAAGRGSWYLYHIYQKLNLLSPISGAPPVCWTRSGYRDEEHSGCALEGLSDIDSSFSAPGRKMYKCQDSARNRASLEEREKKTFVQKKRRNGIPGRQTSLCEGWVTESRTQEIWGVLRSTHSLVQSPHGGRGR